MFIPVIYDDRHAGSSAIFFFIIAAISCISVLLGVVIEFATGLEEFRVVIPLVNIKFYAGPIYLTWLTSVFAAAGFCYWCLVKKDIDNVFTRLKTIPWPQKIFTAFISLFFQFPLMVFVGVVLFCSAALAGYLGFVFGDFFQLLFS